MKPGIRCDPSSCCHHNLLDESKIYVEDCTIEHSEELVNRLEEENVPLFLSGHLHVQHYMRNEEDRGIYEIVTSSFLHLPASTECWNTGMMKAFPITHNR